tara:strand:- start:4107 stop:4823 length:717 start_codon:yes stop_codon:yes gene_type:complete
MRSYTVKKIEHKVYDDPTEVPDDVIIQPDWKVSEIGDWVLCDDGSVIEILRQGWVKFRKTRYRYVGTCTGTFICKPNIKMDSIKRRNIYSFGGDKNTLDSIKDRKNLTTQEMLFAKFVANGMNPEEAYLKVYKTNNVAYAKERSAILVKQERVVMAIKEELDDVFKDLGIDLKYLISKAKDELEIGERPADRLKALQMLWDAADVVPKGTKVTQLSGAVFQGFNQDSLLNAKRPELKE